MSRLKRVDSSPSLPLPPSLSFSLPLEPRELTEGGGGGEGNVPFPSAFLMLGVVFIDLTDLDSSMLACLLYERLIIGSILTAIISAVK